MYTLFIHLSIDIWTSFDFLRIMSNLITNTDIQVSLCYADLETIWCIAKVIQIDYTVSIQLLVVGETSKLSSTVIK